jgi:hypothetical protein
MASTKDLLNRIKGNNSGLLNTKKPTGPSGAAAAPGPTKTGKFIICTPAKIYIVLATISMLYYVSAGQSLTWLIVKSLIFILVGFLLNKLCNSGFKAIAWLLAIVPQCILLVLTIQSTPSTTPAPQPSMTF